jgi:predicted DNA-binding transcriptional regulator YafY
VVPATPIMGRRNPRSHGPPWECRPRRSASIFRGGTCSPAECHETARIPHLQDRAVKNRRKLARATVCVAPPSLNRDRRAGTAPITGRSEWLGKHTATRFPLERVAALDGAIRAGRYPNAGSLARALEVCHRTVQRDIESLGVPLVFDARRHGSTDSDPDDRLPLLTSTQGEPIALSRAERVLQQYRGTTNAPDLARAFRKITAGLPERMTIDLGYLGQAHSLRTTAPTPLDPGLFRDLDAAIQDHRRVVLRYWAASREEETQREVDPYHLASIDGRWSLVGYCHLRAEGRMFIPARIRELTVTDTTFDAPSGFRIDEYLARSFAVLRGGEGVVCL